MNNILKISNDFVNHMKQSGLPVTQAYLFGSYAKGNFHQDSDIDICIVSDSLGKDFIDEMVNLRMESLKIDNRIEPIPYSPSDFADQYDPLAHEIKTHGILLTQTSL